MTKEELRARRRLEAEDQARRRGEGEAAREAQRARDEAVTEIDGVQPGVPLGLAPRERPAWVVGGEELVVVGENERIQPVQNPATPGEPRGAPARVVGATRMASKRKRIERVAAGAGMEVEYDAMLSFAVTARRVRGRGGGAAAEDRGGGRGGAGSLEACGGDAGCGWRPASRGGGKKIRILCGPGGSS